MNIILAFPTRIRTETVIHTLPKQYGYGWWISIGKKQLLPRRGFRFYLQRLLDLEFLKAKQVWMEISKLKKGQISSFFFKKK